MSDPVIEVEPRGGARDYKIGVWLKDLLASTPGAERQVVRAALLNTIRDFFHESYAWRDTQVMTLKAGKSKYYLSPFDAHTDVAGVLAVYVDGRQLKPLPETVHMPLDPATPQYFYCFAPDSIELFPTPDATVSRGLRIVVALVPNANVKRVPAIAMTKFYTTIHHGTLAALHSQVKKPYSDLDSAAAHARLYKSGVGKARLMAAKAYSQADQFSFPFFA